MVVIEATSGYVPLYREDMCTARGPSPRENAVPGNDENNVTVASERTMVTLYRSWFYADDIGAVFAATTSDYFAEHGIARQVAYRLGVTGDSGPATSRRPAGRQQTPSLRHTCTCGGPGIFAAADIMPVTEGGDEEGAVGAWEGAAVLSPPTEALMATIHAIEQATTGFVERHRKHGTVVDPSDDRFDMLLATISTTRPRHNPEARGNVYISGTNALGYDRGDRFY
jgi:hypothetical protein